MYLPSQPTAPARHTKPTRGLPALLLLTGLILFSLAPSASAQVVVDFPDPILEDVIRGEIGKYSGPIYDTDLLGLTHLAVLADVTDLTGMEYCVDLEYAGFAGQEHISDLSPLTNLPNLIELKLMLWDSQVTDLSAFVGLAELTNLVAFGLYDVVGNQLNDISVVAGLTNLSSLKLPVTANADLSPVQALPNLHELDLSGSQLTDISGLAGLSNLRILYLIENQISDISPLAGLTDLWTLFLERNPLDCLSILVHIPAFIANGTRVDWDDDPSCYNDADGDTVPDAIDNCVHHPNTPGSYPAYRTTTGGQLDDDGDGYGNACDGKFSGVPGPVDSLDTLQFKASLNKHVSWNNCGSAADQPCDIFDLDGKTRMITALDTIVYKSLLDQPPGPKCDACGVDLLALPCEGDACP